MKLDPVKVQLTKMENFEQCGWYVENYRVWSDDQGPYLESLDFFIDPQLDKSAFGKKVLGHDYYGREVSLIKKKKQWVLVHDIDGDLSELPTRTSATIEMIEAFWVGHPLREYDYEKSIPSGYKQKVEIGCATHGIFHQDPWHHKRGKGCQNCAKVKNGQKYRLTREIFIERSEAKHGKGTYDYSKSDIIDSKTPTIIGCKIHGDFLQSPTVHMRGSGCPECSKKVVRNQGTIKMFIKKAREVHGDRYDYSETVYTVAKAKVTIICREHGRFQQVAADHLAGSGCPSCNKFRFKPLDEFKVICDEKYEGQYDYSRTNFQKLTDMIEIVCKVQDHGSFWVRATDHISVRGTGCPKCAWKGNDQESFERISGEVHDYYYDYAKSIFNKMKDPVIVICPRHGEFSITPSEHMRLGRGCKHCSLGNLTQSEFIEKSETIFGKGVLDYSRLKYISQTVEVILRCIKHDWTFVQKPVMHLRGKGCLKCAHDKFAMLDIRTDKWFREESRKVHGNKFSYPRSHYTGMTKMVIITCSKHGDFSQMAISHLQGHGCSKCFFSKGEEKVRIFLKSMNITFVEQKTFEGCKDKNLLRYDFYVENHNLLIEYDGAQHFFPVDHWGGQEALENVQRRDKIKDQYAQDKDIRLLRIRYDECVEDKLVEFLNSLVQKIRENIEPQMKFFEVCGWQREGDKIWCQGQGPYLEGLDFFVRDISECDIDESDTIKPIGVDVKGKTVVLSKCQDGKWVLAVWEENQKYLFGLEQRDPRTLMMIQDFWRSKEHPKGTYDYRYSMYTTSGDQVEIICPIHGLFSQERYNHQKGAGCHDCAVKKISDSKRIKTEEFIRRSREKFGDVLDYSETSCTGMNDPVTIVCPKNSHGKFCQIAKIHLASKFGCPKCREE